jgi:benzoyl-CoA-dihydrodiol lyase
MLDARNSDSLHSLDDIDWQDEIRVFLEGAQASRPMASRVWAICALRAGDDESKSSPTTAWQNWIFQRPNAVGEDGALRRYGTGQKAAFDTKRV